MVKLSLHFFWSRFREQRIGFRVDGCVINTYTRVPIGLP